MEPVAFTAEFVEDRDDVAAVCDLRRRVCRQFRWIGDGRERVVVGGVCVADVQSPHTVANTEPSPTMAILQCRVQKTYQLRRIQNLVADARSAFAVVCTKLASRHAFEVSVELHRVVASQTCRDNDTYIRSRPKEYTACLMHCLDPSYPWVFTPLTFHSVGYEARSSPDIREIADVFLGQESNDKREDGSS